MARTRKVKKQSRRQREVIANQYLGEVSIGRQYNNSTHTENHYRAYEDAANEEPFNASVTVKFTPTQKDALQKIAALKGMDVSEMVREAMDVYLKFNNVAISR